MAEIQSTKLKFNGSLFCYADCEPILESDQYYHILKSHKLVVKPIAKIDLGNWIGFVVEDQKERYHCIRFSLARLDCKITDLIAYHKYQFNQEVGKTSELNSGRLITFGMFEYDDNVRKIFGQINFSLYNRRPGLDNIQLNDHIIKIIE